MLVLRCVAGRVATLVGPDRCNNRNAKRDAGYLIAPSCNATSIKTGVNRDARIA